MTIADALFSILAGGLLVFSGAWVALRCGMPARLVLAAGAALAVTAVTAGMFRGTSGAGLPASLGVEGWVIGCAVGALVFLETAAVVVLSARRVQA